MSKGNVGIFASNLPIPVLDDSRKTEMGRLVNKDTFNINHNGRNDLGQQFGTLSCPCLSIEGDSVFDHMSGDSV